MAIPINASYLTTTFTETKILGMEWIIGIIIVLITMAVITRDFEKWKLLAFPVAIASVVLEFVKVRM